MDVKRDNILLVPSETAPGGYVIKVIDFDHVVVRSDWYDASFDAWAARETKRAFCSVRDSEGMQVQMPDAFANWHGCPMYASIANHLGSTAFGWIDVQSLCFCLSQLLDRELPWYKQPTYMPDGKINVMNMVAVKVTCLFSSGEPPTMWLARDVCIVADEHIETDVFEILCEQVQSLLDLLPLQSDCDISSFMVTDVIIAAKLNEKVLLPAVYEGYQRVKEHVSKWLDSKGMLPLQPIQKTTADRKIADDCIECRPTMGPELPTVLHRFVTMVELCLCSHICSTEGLEDDACACTFSHGLSSFDCDCVLETGGSFVMGEFAALPNKKTAACTARSKLMQLSVNVLQHLVWCQGFWWVTPMCLTFSNHKGVMALGTVTGETFDLTNLFAETPLHWPGLVVLNVTDRLSLTAMDKLLPELAELMQEALAILHADRPSNLPPDH